jgi:hypothetical protein
MQVMAHLLRDYPEIRASLSRLDPRLAEVQVIDLAPITRLDRRQAADTLRMLAQQLEVAPLNASITVVDGAVATTESMSGQAMDRPASSPTWVAAGELADSTALSCPLMVTLSHTRGVNAQNEVKPSAEPIPSACGIPSRMSG